MGGFVRGGLVSGGLVREWSYKWRGLQEGGGGLVGGLVRERLISGGACKC